MVGEVLSGWTQVIDAETGEVANVPLVAEVFDYEVWEDATGQAAPNLIPVPNLLIVRLQARPAVFDAIAADARFRVLWSE